MQNAVELGHEHLVDLMLEHVVVPVHAVRNHHERGPVFDQISRHQRVLREAPRAVAFAISGGEFVQVEQVCACRHAAHPLERGVLASGDRALAVALELRGEKPAQRFARFAIVRGNRLRSLRDEPRVITAHTNRGVLGSEPAGPVARFESFKLVAAGDGINEDEIRNRRIELTQGVRDRASKGGTREACALRISTLQQGDGLQVFRLRGLHAADDVQPVRDRRAPRHQR